MKLRGIVTKTDMHQGLSFSTYEDEYSMLTNAIKKKKRDDIVGITVTNCKRI